jgi:hypothetical protein
MGGIGSLAGPHACGDSIAVGRGRKEKGGRGFRGAQEAGPDRKRIIELQRDLCRQVKMMMHHKHYGYAYDDDTVVL